ncbi:MAG: CPBP family intramembrane glutamate endopeptidase, partial [Microcystis sp.]
MTNSPNSEFDPLTRTQVLTIMAVTAIILLVVAKVWQYFGAIAIPAIRWTLPDFLFGLALAGAISGISGLLYRFWPSYRHSANSYLELVIKPLA